ncbi:MAG: hypothetical protein IIA45_14490 [Bacteroidetes bacterium]|nr:hypothetical protein [Bacteroidota bacterium]
MHIHIASIFIAVVLLGGCIQPSCISATADVEYVIFGNGGGASGLVEEYKVTKDGCLFYRDTKAQFDKIGLIKRGEIRKIFRDIRTINLSTSKIIKPGNLYFFIRYSERNKLIIDITWGEPGFLPPQEIIDIYDSLIKKTKALK